jgi:mono/diheme cytochrome c family protein
MSRVQLEILLGTFFLALTGLILIIVGVDEEIRMSDVEGQHQAQSIEVGAELFEINCRGCHGLRGEGIPGLAPPLNDPHFFTQRVSEVGWGGSLEDYIIATVATGRQVSTRPDLYPGAGSPAMPTWSEQYGGPLRDDQIDALAAFIINWEATALGDVELAELPTPAASAEELDDPVARGLTLYNNSGCGGCHTIDGLSGGTVGPVLTNIASVAETRVEGLSADEYLRQSILEPSAYLVEGYDDLMLKSFGESLSQTDLDDLIAFLLSQE